MRPNRNRQLLERVTTAIAAALLLGAALSGCESCTNGTGETEGCRASMLAGDLVVTEIMANPDGADDGKEWFEIFNASNNPIDLTGLKIVISRADATDAKTLELTGSTIEPGAYFVLGGVLESVKPTYVDYAYGADLGDLRNNGGRISLECDEVKVDRVVYVEMSDGVAVGFDGAQAPDAVANDDLLKWCDASVEYEPGSLGTPGAANPSCGYVPPGQCDGGGGQFRAKVKPMVGDLVITEFMANPAAEDSGKEWFEVHVVQDVDLNGLEIGKTPGSVEEMIPEGDCFRVIAGSRVLFAQGSDPGLNGGLPTPDVLFDFSLLNSDGELFIGLEGAVVDAISYTASTSGAASALDPAHVDAAENDGDTWWCAATDSYGPGGLGTPAAANPSCGIVPPGQCEEAGGSLRNAVVPAPGDLVITEFMPNPAQSDDAGGEWFELQALRDVDLNGLEIGRVTGTVVHTLDQPQCLRITAGSYAVLARSADPLLNGGLPQVDAETSLSLVNSNGSLFVSYAGQLIDSVSYASSGTGAATSLDPTFVDAVANDDPATWCEAVDAYGDGDLGSPGGANPSCGFVPAGQCYDGGNLRAKAIPGLGDLVITEFMANPSAVSDASGEWFEVWVGATVDLNGVVIGRTPGSPDVIIPEGDCARVTANNYLLFARDAASATNGHLPAVDYTIDFGLTNNGGSLYVGLEGTLLDQVTWAASGTGAATSLDPAQRDPTANDNAANWCPATSPYGNGDLGTPRADNPACP